MYIGHTKDGKTYSEDSECQPLRDHLLNVANYSRKYASDFGACEEAYFMGYLHDIGKYKSDFQDYIKGISKNRVGHAAEGAIKILDLMNEIGILYALPVACHHTGLKDLGEKNELGGNTFYSMINRHDEQLLFIPEDIIPSIPKNLKKMDTENPYQAFSFATYIKMLFSCLVDADWTDTEEFVKQIKRKTISYDYGELYKKLIDVIPKNDGRKINNIRAEILKQCINKSTDNQGLFSLTVPTGGGKTYASLAFALNHAKVHGLNRIIYVIPYTSIIEQNAQVISEAIGEEYVLEHHSGKEYGEDNQSMIWASENWDIPIILTTNVQFFESFFSNKTSKCRKLHNISKSVVIFDEVQIIPLQYISPSYFAISELIKNYKVTSVLCSATQPNIKNYIYKNLKISEIIDNPIELNESLKRVKYEFVGGKTDDEIIDMTYDMNQNLIIVNSRKHAFLLFNKIFKKIKNVYHLSTLMNPVHRTEIINKIKEDLKDKKNIILVSTQLIEAGVDIDFQAVFRSMAGIDSIVQSAGRANRENKSNEGKVIIFESNEKYGKIPRILRPFATVAKGVIDAMGEKAYELEGINKYYSNLYSLAEKDNQLDNKNILSEFSMQQNNLVFNYEKVAEKFKLIENNTYNLVIGRTIESKKIISKIKNGDYNYKTIREVGKYIVNIYENELRKLQGDNVVEEIIEGLFILTNDNYYSDSTGLQVFSEENLNAESIML